MTFEKIILLSAFVGLVCIGLGYLASPTTLYGLYSIEISSTNQFNMVRAAYGGLFLGFSLLFLMGARSDLLALPALVALLTFMSGFALGRFTSIVVDGMPSALILCLLVSEVFYAVVSWLLIRKRLAASTTL